MKRITLITALFISCLLWGCGKKYDLPDDPIVFEEQTFTNPDDSSDTYESIIYNDRIYIDYGTLKNYMPHKAVDQCIGYIGYKDALGEVAAKVLTLNDTEDYLFVVLESVMGDKVFYRAVDTKDHDIDTPKYIESLDFDYWK